MFLTSIVLCFAVVCCNMAAAQEKLLLCYYGTWATYRHGLGKFDVEHIDPNLCTHLIYTFVGINDQGTVISLDPYLDLPDNWGRDNFGKFNDLKKNNPKLKTILAVGGWNEGSAKYSVMAGDPALRKNFVASVLDMIRTHGFDGLDVDWEYPNRRDTVHGQADVDNFTKLLKELKEAFEPHGLILTAAVSAVEEMATQSYDIPAITKYVDIISIMAYDMYGPWDPVTGHNAALHKGEGDEGRAPEALYTVDFALKYWLDQGCPPEKLVLGVPFYGRTFTLSNTYENGVRAPSSGPGIAGPFTGTNGIIGYNELCTNMLTESWNVRFDSLARVPYAVRDRVWVSYDDPESLVEKLNYGSNYGIAGVMVWSIETDDFHGLCYGETFPLLKTLNRAMGKSITTETPITSTTVTYSPTTIPPTESTSTQTNTPTTLPETTSTQINAATNPSETSSTQTNTPTTPPETTTTQTNAATTPSETNLTQTNAPTTLSTTVSPIINNDSTVCTEGGYIADPKDCISFYICVELGNGQYQQYKFQCPNGLHWDRQGFYCNYPQYVNCNP